MWNKWDNNSGNNGFPISRFWEPLEPLPDTRIPTDMNWNIWPQNDVPDTVARLLETIPHYTMMAPYGMPHSYITSDSNKKALSTELPPRIYSHPEIPKVVFYNGSWKDMEIQHYLGSINRKKNEQSEVYLNTTQWMDIYQRLPWNPQEKVKNFQKIFMIDLYGVIDWGTRILREFNEAVYFWASPTDKYIGCNAIRMTENGIVPVFARNEHGLLLLLPKLEQ